MNVRQACDHAGQRTKECLMIFDAVETGHVQEPPRRTVSVLGRHERAGVNTERDVLDANAVGSG